MGSLVELNDTLQITTEQGFPATELNLQSHRKKPLAARDFAKKIFEFYGKEGARIYHPAPNRCFLVHNINGKWLFWGTIVIVEQTIRGEDKEKQTTSGKYKIIEIYNPEFQEQMTRHDSPKGRSYF